MIDLNIAFVDHPFGELNTLHGFVKKSERKILRYSSRQGLRPFPSSCALAFTLRFSTNSVFNCGFQDYQKNR